MTTKCCPYETLGVSQNASPKEIKKAYIKACFEFHPDRKGNQKEDSIMFQRIAASFEILGNETKRREYDQSFHQRKQEVKDAEKRASDTKKYGRKLTKDDDPEKYKYWEYDVRNWQGHPNYKGPVYMKNWKFALLLIAVTSVASSLIYLNAFNKRTEYMKHLDNLNAKYALMDQGKSEQLKEFIEKKSKSENH